MRQYLKLPIAFPNSSPEIKPGNEVLDMIHHARPSDFYDFAVTS